MEQDLCSRSNEACDDGWLQHEGYCYYIANEAVTWKEARDKCLEKDATLTSIWESGTNEFIKRNKDKGKRYWIGLKRTTTDGKKCCQWLDESNSTWSTWAKGEPDRSGNCTIMAKNGKWRDRTCNVSLRYICKKADERGSSLAIMKKKRASTVIPVSVGVVVVVFIIVLIIVAVVLVKRRKKSRQEQSREPTEDNIYSEPPTTSGDPSLEMLPSNELGHGRERQSVLSDGITNDAQDDVCYRNYAAALSDRTATSSNDVINTSAQNVSELYAVVRKNREESSSGQSNNHVVAESDPEMGQMYVNVGEDPQESSMTFQDSSNVIHKSDEDVSQLYAAVRKEKKIEDSSEVEMAENPNYTSYEG